MTNDFKSDEVVHHDLEEPHSKYQTHSTSPLKSDASVCQLLHSFLKQREYSSILKVATNVANRENSAT
jgi:hypothetical protein